MADVLWGVLVGGAVTAFVQWAVTPRVQRRIRAEERSETALVEMGNLLEDDLPDARRRITTSRTGMAFLDELIAEGKIGEEDARVEQFREEDVEAMRQAFNHWERLTKDLERLERSAGMRWRFESRKYELALLGVSLMAIRPADPEGWDSVWAEEDEARKVLLKSVTERLDRISLTRPSWLRSRWIKVRRRFRSKWPRQLKPPKPQ